jgi:regulator of replication initiation timing
MAITSQLKKMSAKTVDLIAENEALTVKVNKLKTSNSLMTESEKELAKKNQANQRVIKMLVERLKGGNNFS